MKKIMFNDRYGLTEAVLGGRKTVTRRLINKLPNNYTNAKYMNYCLSLKKPPYEVGEIVAVAQSYRDAYNPPLLDENGNHYVMGNMLKGWNDKRCVCADLMTHQIRILDVRAERLQDITEEDCLREYPECDIIRERHVNKCVAMGACVISNWMERRQVFAWLIDKISGKGTWNANPYVWRIEFELIK